ncbi:hypothetical protein BE04_01845 [Sorangium cellulosum]|uniref:AAA-ATPase-like domain-containing protein n=1 Tax=Sorangium cellulosum TaxID=56 RepID=A0A150NY79_SORCE|nr:AAA family ATPase [Sorangium cellulosum]KYF46707.1 hypothetical protein BE04_01845 [Sorangium cellulosum]
MSLRIALGIDDFRKLRESGLEYVDKTRLIRELIDAEDSQVALLPRPRRFGKTLNLSMLRWFFEKRQEDLSRLFEDLSIWQAGERYRAHFQRYPVIYLTLKAVQQETFERCFAALREKIVALYDQHRYAARQRPARGRGAAPLPGSAGRHGVRGRVRPRASGPVQPSPPPPRRARRDAHR